MVSMEMAKRPQFTARTTVFREHLLIQHCIKAAVDAKEVTVTFQRVFML